MIKVTTENYSIIKETIGRAPTFVYSILDQVIEGAVYADNAIFHSLLFQTDSGIYYVYGDSSSEALISKLVTIFQESIEQSKRFTLFSYSDDWSAKIEQRLNGCVKKLERYTFSFDINAYNNREKRNSLDYDFIKINQQQIDHCLEFDNKYYEEYWGSTSNFLENGFGFCLQHGDKIISEAVSIFNFFQQVIKYLLKEVKASGGCHGFGKECFVQAQSRIRTQLYRGIIDIASICRG